MKGKWKFFKRLILLVFICFFASGFSTRNLNYFINPSYTPEFLIKKTQWADSVLNTLALEEKIAQLMMIQVFSNASEENIKETEKLIEKYQVGGIIFSRGGPVRQANITNRFQGISKTPMLIAMDAEWGLAMRLDSAVSYPYEITLGAIADNSLIYDMGRQIAEQCKRLGVHMNFAPVVDINNNPMNPVINHRSFGEDRGNVMVKGLMYMLGMQDNKLLTTIKHFPGHGDTKQDSHQTLPVINHTREHLDSVEIYPFQQLINNGATGVMVAHLNIPALDSTKNRASTLSPEIVTDFLKIKLGFGGLIVTDALEMRGVSDYYDAGEIEVEAFKAGNDILLMPSDVPKAIYQIKKEVKKGRISEEEIDERCLKILKAKEWVGLNKYKPVETKNLYSDLNIPEYYVLKSKLIENSLTLLKNDNKIIPFKRLDTLNIAVVSLNAGSKTLFQKTIDLYLESSHFQLNTESQTERNKILDTLKYFNTVIIGIHNTNNSVGKYFGITSTDILFLNEAVKINPNIVFCMFANPYSLGYFNSFKGFRSLTIANQPGDEYEELMAQALFGGVAFKGKIPVKPHHDIELKTGIPTIPGRLAYNIPEYCGLNSDSLKKIDVIVEDAIAQKATPGCQVIVSRNGVVVYNRSFGYFTYQKKEKVEASSLYDIASLTKIFATTPSVMKLYDEKKLSVDTPVSIYLPSLDTTNKKNVKIKEIMTHQARLNGWIPFYLGTLESLFPDRDLFNKQISNSYPLQMSKDMYITRFLKYKDGIYSHEKTSTHSTQVADGFYILNSYRDSVFNNIANSELREKNNYKYSDLGYYWLYKITENLTKTRFEDYNYKTFYSSIGASTTGFNPLLKFDKTKIVPTEDDLIFRKQLIWGYVHDPGAAMMGGVCGHAGLFSNANDLCKMMQMYLNKGEYGYIQYINKQTIELFTSSPYKDNNNRRGIGFDKPPFETNGLSPVSQYCSPESFGHSGFTGTLAWADPKYNLVYIFISNRVHPDQNNNKLTEMNVRTRIQDVIYRSIIKE